MTFQKPSREEEEFIARQEAETKRRLALQRGAELAAEEHKRLQELHFMHCPKCGMKLEEIVFRGVRVDKCFYCNGLWFDAGEFERCAGKEHDFVRSIVNLFR